MRRWIMVFALIAACVAHAEHSPQQQEEASKIVDRDLKRMKNTGQETRRLNDMIQRASPDQKHEYGKLVKQRDLQTLGTPWEAPSALNAPSPVTEPSHPAWHAPGNAELPYRSPGRSPAVKESLQATRSACEASTHPEHDATCQALSTSSGY